MERKDLLHSRVERDGSGGARILVRVGVYHTLELIDVALSLILDDMIMDRASSALNGRVRVQVEVVLKWMSDITLNQSTGERVVVLVRGSTITLLGEETDVVALGANSVMSQSLRI
jgi:hypothetical protein